MRKTLSVNVMRFRHVLPVAAVLALGGCLAQQPDKASEKARTAISPAAMTAPACPPAPVCTPAKPAAARGATHRPAVRVAKHHAARPAAVHRSVRRWTSDGSHRNDDLAGGPPAYGHHRWEGGGGRKDHRQHRYADDGGYRYGTLPPARDWRADDGLPYEDRAYDDPRNRRGGPGPGGYRGRPYDDRDRDDDRWRDERWERPDDGAGYYYRHGGAGRGPHVAAPVPPPAPRAESGGRIEERYSRREGPTPQTRPDERREHGYAWRDRAPPPAPPPPGEGGRTVERYSSHDASGAHRQGGYDRGGMRHDYDARREAERSVAGEHERGASADRRWSRWGERSSESSSSSYVERTSSGGPDCNCDRPAQAAGFDRNGFLTWPGKIPARP